MTPDVWSPEALSAAKISASGGLTFGNEERILTWRPRRCISGCAIVRTSENWWSRVLQDSRLASRIQAAKPQAPDLPPTNDVTELLLAMGNRCLVASGGLKAAPWHQAVLEEDAFTQEGQEQRCKIQHRVNIREAEKETRVRLIARQAN